MNKTTTLLLYRVPRRRLGVDVYFVRPEAQADFEARCPKPICCGMIVASKQVMDSLDPCGAIGAGSSLPPYYNAGY